jgi:hypothetical protein
MKIKTTSSTKDLANLGRRIMEILLFYGILKTFGVFAHTLTSIFVRGFQLCEAHDLLITLHDHVYKLACVSFDRTYSTKRRKERGGFVYERKMGGSLNFRHLFLFLYALARS